MWKAIKSFMSQTEKSGNGSFVIPISLVISIVIATWFLSERLFSIDSKLTKLEERFVDQWTKRDMELWTLKLKLGNQGITVPEVK